ncbi:MAG: L-threonylcarbamoyladenylate synthase [Thermoplasmatales archaeon]
MELVKLDPVHPDQRYIKVAARLILGGGTVAFPTETVYGLGANAFDDEACRKIFAIKGRQTDNPIIVHISDFNEISRVSHGLPPGTEDAFRTIWPGPLTVILEKKNIGDVPTAGLDTVAVRMPAHRIPQMIIRESGVPIAAPSANKSGSPSPVMASEVLEDLDSKADMIIDGGRSFFGVESTVIMFREDEIVILRPGAFSAEELKDIFKRKVTVPRSIEGAPISPGMKYRHYSPEKELILGLTLESIERLCSDGNTLFIGSAETARKVNCKSLVLGSKDDLYEVARNLFTSFRALDRSRFGRGVIETFEEKGIGLAIMNRIRKATGGRSF